MKLNDYKNLVEYAELSPNRGKLKNPDIKASGENTLCGDSLVIYLNLKNGKIIAGKFEHSGCALSAASTALLLDYARGKNYKKITELSGEQLLKLLGIEVSPARLPCALLPLAVLKELRNK